MRFNGASAELGLNCHRWRNRCCNAVLTGDCCGADFETKRAGAAGPGDLRFPENLPGWIQRELSGYPSCCTELFRTIAGAVFYATTRRASALPEELAARALKTIPSGKDSRMLACGSTSSLASDASAWLTSLRRHRLQLRSLLATGLADYHSTNGNAAKTTRCASG